MNDQEKAREELAQRMRDVNTPDVWGLSRLVPMHAYLDAVLSADPRVIAEAMGGEVQTFRGERAWGEAGELQWEPEYTVSSSPTHERTVIVLSPRKVES